MPNDSEERLKMLEKMTSDHDVALWGDREDMDARPGLFNMVKDLRNDSGAMRADLSVIKTSAGKAFSAIIFTCISVSVTAVCAVLWLGFKAVVKAP